MVMENGRGLSLANHRDSKLVRNVKPPFHLSLNSTLGIQT
jgi:hypothetical protein